MITYLIATIAVYIAWQQWKTSEDKLRLELYQKRFVVYENTLALRQILLSMPPIPSEARFLIESNFIKSYRESQFLFKCDDGVFQLLGEVQSRTTLLKNVPSSSNVYIGKPEGQLIDTGNFLEELKLIDKIIAELEIKLAKYLNFHKVF